jgi:ABC-2 type transport system permease protein
MRNILRRLLARHRTFLISCAVVLAAFQLVICAIVSSIDVGSVLEQLLALAPPAMRTLFEQSMLGSAQGILAFALNHPVTHALMTAVAITLAARAIAGEVEHGAIELVLAQPISRTRYFMAHVAFGLGAITIVAGAAIAGSVLGRHLFGLAPLGASRAWRVLANLVLLQAAFYSVTLLLSAFGREAGQVASAGVLLAVVSYLIDVIASMWSKAAFLQPYSLHHYYDPRRILTEGHLPSASVPVLATFVIVTAGAAFVHFYRRDLP